MQRILLYIGSTDETIAGFPVGVQDEVFHALAEALKGETTPSVKPLRGFGGASVREIRVRGTGGTYRTVFTVQFKEAIYVLHAFQKKSKTGIKTEKKDVDLIKRRLKAAKEDHKKRYGKK